MAFDTPTLDEAHENGISLHRALLPELDVSDESHNWKWLRVEAGVSYGNYAHHNVVQNDVMPDTATGDMADRWGSIRGVRRKTATPARKALALRFVGTPGTLVPDNTSLTHVPSGLQYRVVGGGAVGASQNVDVGLVALDVGSKTRLPAGEVLTLQQPIPGLQDEAELQIDIDEGGDDAEIDGTYVPRYLEHWKNPPLGGTQSDFEKLATAAKEEGGGGKAAAFCYPLRGGLGTVDVAALNAGSGLFRIMSPVEVAELFAIMNPRRPAGMKAFRVLTVVAQTVSVEAAIVDNGAVANAFDWEDDVPPKCAKWDPATRMMQLDRTLPPSMRPNGRIIISDGMTGRERVIEATLPLANSIVLAADTAGVVGDVPVPGGVIYAGGPLVEPSRSAVQVLFDGLGTANPDNRRYGTWEGSLRPSAISRALTGVPGVLDLAGAGDLAGPLAPTSTVTASDLPFPDDASIGLLIAGRILIRKAH